MNILRFFLSLCLLSCFTGRATASQLLNARLETKLLPSPVEFAALLPDDYETVKEPLPLLFFLHGGGGDKSFLNCRHPIIDEMWKAGTLSPMVLVTPDAPTQSAAA